MTGPLDGISLQPIFRLLELQSEAQKLLQQVGSSPPPRMSGSRVGNMPVWYPGRKMQFIIKVESAMVEFAFLLEGR